MTELLALGLHELIAVGLIAFGAGVVRGFTGFALSAVVMVFAVTILEPIELIPMLWWLEMTASILMVRSGLKDANKRVALGLVATSAIGLPLGLTLTMLIAPEISRLVALMIIGVLASLQLARLRLAALATRPGLALTGLTAGMVTGLSGAGGMVVALYTLALDAPSRVIRASLVLYLFAALSISFFTYIATGTMDAQAITRGLSFAVPTAIGVIVGKALFVPRYEAYYKPVCLGLLVIIAGAGIIRELVT